MKYVKIKSLESSLQHTNQGKLIILFLDLRILNQSDTLKIFSLSFPKLIFYIVNLIIKYIVKHTLKKTRKVQI